MTAIKYFVGVDIASATFTASVGATPWKVILKAHTFDAKRTENGYQTFLEWLANQQIGAKESVVCMQATGVYSAGLAYFLFATGYAVAVQSPLEVKRTFKP